MATPTKTSNALEDVVAFVQVTNAGGLNASHAFGNKLLSHGAKLANKLTKDVTHIVFKGPDDELNRMYERAERVAPVPATVVGVTWISCVDKEHKRPLERPHVLPRPREAKDALLLTPMIGSGKKVTGAKRRRSMQPKSAEHYGTPFCALLPYLPILLFDISKVTILQS